MKSLTRMKLIMFKEVRSIFISPIFFVIAAFFCLLMGWIFFNLLVTYLESVHNHMVNQSNVTFTDGVLKPFFTNMNFLFALITPVFTMRTLATERERGTLDLLFSTSLRPWELILGKWIASIVSLYVLVGLSFIIPVVLFASNLPLGEILLAGYGSILFNITLYASLGIFVSTLTNNQSVAALMTLVSILFMWMIPWASQTSHNLLLIEIYQYLGVMTHFSRILGGVITSSDIFYYFSTSLLFLIGSIVFLSRRRS